MAIPFYSKYTLGAGPRAPFILFGTCFIVAIAVVSFWGKLVREWGIKRTWLWAIAVMTLSAVVIGVVPNLAVGILGAAVAGMGLGGVKVCREMILASLVDRSKARRPESLEALQRI